MSDLQTWVLIVGGLVTVWHWINVWGRLSAAREVLRASDPVPVETNGSNQ